MVFIKHSAFHIFFCIHNAHSPTHSHTHIHTHQWMNTFWKSDSCYKKLGVDGTNCSFQIYLSEVRKAYTIIYMCIISKCLGIVNIANEAIVY